MHLILLAIQQLDNAAETTLWNSLSAFTECRKGPLHHTREPNPFADAPAGHIPGQLCSQCLSAGLIRTRSSIYQVVSVNQASNGVKLELLAQRWSSLFGDELCKDNEHLTTGAKWRELRQSGRKEKSLSKILPV